MATPMPLYRLRQLIYGKYGEEKFALGCEITARWVAFETRRPCKMEDVQFWCNVLTQEITTDAHLPIAIPQMRAIMQLFGITNELELFNDFHSHIEHLTQQL
jgi:hypothetical protein